MNKHIQQGETLHPVPEWLAECTEDQVTKMYPFGYFVFEDGSVWGRDPLQEANAGLDVDPAEIDAALQMMKDEQQHEVDYFFDSIHEL